jgi:putative SOS response-associated peptidase YedK
MRALKPLLFITLPDKKPIAFAGLWETWGEKDRQSLYRSCTIITTEACEAMRDIHHRMPAILKPEMYEFWLNPDNQDTAALKRILETALLTDSCIDPVDY